MEKTVLDLALIKLINDKYRHLENDHPVSLISTVFRNLGVLSGVNYVEPSRAILLGQNQEDIYVSYQDQFYLFENFDSRYNEIVEAFKNNSLPAGLKISISSH